MSVAGGNSTLEDDGLLQDDDSGRLSRDFIIGSTVTVVCLFLVACAISAFQYRRLRNMPATEASPAPDVVDRRVRTANSRNVMLVPNAVIDLPTAKRLDSDSAWTDEENKEEPPRRRLPPSSRPLPTAIAATTVATGVVAPDIEAADVRRRGV